MSYAGALSLLQSYKMQKTDSDYKIVDLQNEILNATSISMSVNNLFDTKIAEVDTAISRLNELQYNSNGNETNYLSGQPKEKDTVDRVILDLQSLDLEVFGDLSPTTDFDSLKAAIKNKRDRVIQAEYEMTLSKIAAEEHEVQSDLQQEQTVNALLSANIQNMQAMVQSGIPKRHTYGYQ